MLKYRKRTEGDEKDGNIKNWRRFIDMVIWRGNEFRWRCNVWGCSKRVMVKKYPPNEKNQIELPTDPILIQMDGKNFLVETGLGKGKLTEKQLRNFGVTRESELDES